MAYKDKEDQARATRAWRERNKEYVRQDAVARTKRKRKENFEYVKKLKESQPCMDCNKFFPHVAMDYDHVRGEKVREVAELVRRTASFRTIDAEIAKCELVCSNCHRIRTWNRGRSSSPVKDT